MMIFLTDVPVATNCAFLMTPARDILQSRVLFLNNELLTKATAAQNEVAFSYHRVRGLYFLAVVFAANIVIIR